LGSTKRRLKREGKIGNRRVRRRGAKSVEKKKDYTFVGEERKFDKEVIQWKRASGEKPMHYSGRTQETLRLQTIGFESLEKKGDH